MVAEVYYDPPPKGACIVIVKQCPGRENKYLLPGRCLLVGNAAPSIFGDKEPFIMAPPGEAFGSWASWRYATPDEEAAHRLGGK